MGRGCLLLNMWKIPPLFLTLPFVIIIFFILVYNFTQNNWKLSFPKYCPVWQCGTSHPSGWQEASVPDGWTVFSLQQWMMMGGGEVGGLPESANKIQDICIRKVFCQSLLSGGICGRLHNSVKSYSECPKQIQDHNFPNKSQFLMIIPVIPA